MKYLWVVIFLVLLIWSGIQPKSQATWVLEVLPAIIGTLILVFTYQKFRLTTLLYVLILLILLHCIILMVGGHYTYAEVPFFFCFFGTERNNNDKLGHFAQGFVPALIAREILIRKNVVNGQGWLNFFVICIAMTLSAVYELVEWGVAVISGEGADAFLGTQGYVWDTQSDMAMALIGALCALIFVSKIHDDQLAKLATR